MAAFWPQRHSLPGKGAKPNGFVGKRCRRLEVGLAARGAQWPGTNVMLELQDIVLLAR